MTKDDTEYSWLIEAPATRYLYVVAMGGADSVARFFNWTTDHNAALRFRTKEQAEDVLFAVRTMDRTHCNGDLFSFERHLGDVKAVEHGWMKSEETT